MNEAVYNLYAITGDPDHLTMATYFYKAVFMDPLANAVDSLNNSHANTHLPEIIGVQRGWELTGNATLRRISDFFYHTLSTSYSVNAPAPHSCSPSRPLAVFAAHPCTSLLVRASMVSVRCVMLVTRRRPPPDCAHR